MAESNHPPRGIVFDVCDHPEQSDLDALESALVAFNAEVAPPERYAPIAVFARRGGTMVGGAAGFTHWNWLFVEHVWVSHDLRGAGVGSSLMGNLELLAARRGAIASRVSTYSFQAPRFYLTLGYRRFATLEDYPTGGQLVFYWKSLGAGNAIDVDGPGSSR